MLRYLWLSFARHAGSFARSERGNFAMMFAVMSVPLMVAVGGVIDYSRASSARTEMQDALDATSLALSRQANVDTMTTAQMQTFATNYFNANFNTGNVINLTVSPSYSSTGPSVTVAGAATVKTTFLNLIGMTGVPINATSTTIWGESRLRVALVLDNTGSMADDGKMDALHTATHNLLDQLKNAASVDGDVYVSIIPFSKDVNVGSSNYNKSWVRWDLWDEVNGSCSRTWYTNKTDCENAGRRWTADNHNTWNGCITDRDQDYDTKNTAPSSSSTRFPAEEYSNCPQQMIGLTYDWTALNNKVDAMFPNGNTNQAIGLQWGWQSLTQSPFTIPAEDPKYDYKQIIILLTDGLNTQDRWYTSQSSIDARQKITCQNVKDAGITLYTVQVNTGGDPMSQMLKDCASTPDNFFLLTSANQIVTTFNSIGTALSNLRLKS
ncbi:MAG TPA: pilus assembly protein [Bauldia sp.]|nr:pilus assembly protein [Bauldia sp.]